mmetsp:Transcript_38609/g.109184  ORF Transcript_38609/g.109184 Transcript_38609/m.109184 type:complete len:293 (-) Transcript_38609:1117-1995(-)
MRIHGGEGVVQQVHVGHPVDSPCQSHPVLLPTRQVDSLLPNLRVVPRRKDQEVLLKAAGTEGLSVLVLVVGPAPEDVVPHGLVLDPGVLASVGNAPAHCHRAGQLDALSEDGLQQAALPAAHLAHHHQQLPGHDLQIDALKDGLLCILRPCEGGVVQDRDCGLARSGHRAGLHPRGFLKVDKLLKAFVGNLGVDEVVQLHGEHDDGEAQQVEERQCRKGDGGGELLAQRCIHPKCGHGDEDWAGGEGEHVEALEEGGLSNLLELYVAEAAQPLVVGLLPGVELDSLDSCHHL